MPERIKEIMAETIKEEFFSPMALLVAVLVAFVELKWFRRRFPILAGTMVAGIIYIQFPSLWKEALMIGLFCVVAGLLLSKG